MSEAGYQVEWQISKLEVRILNDNWAHSKEEQKISLIYGKDVFLFHSETKNYSNFLKENKTASDASSRLFLHLKVAAFFFFYRYLTKFWTLQTLVEL